MKQKTAMILLWLILLQSTLVIPAFSAVPPEGWKALRDNLHLNVKTVTRLDGNTISAWIYLVPQKDSDTFLAAEQQLKALKKDSNDLEYIGYLSEIDCGKSRYRKITTVFFKDDSNIITSHQRSNAGWKGIEVNSIFHDLYLSVCGKEKMANTL